MEHLRMGWRKLGWRDDQLVHGRPLPTGGQFGHGHDTLDPDLFDAHERMHPWIRLSLIHLLDSAWHERWPDWRDWARIYLAGSLASYWWGTLDLDVLVGVHADKLFKAHPEVLNATANAEEDEVSQMITKEFYTGLDIEVIGFRFPPAQNLKFLCASKGIDASDAYEGIPPDVTPLAPVDFTWYCNADSYDIRAIKPYAAYDVTRDLWAVHPVRATKRYGPNTFDNAFWDRVGRVADEIQEALGRDDATERHEDAVALYEQIHSERNQAFGPEGGGQWDPRALQWTVLNRWGLLGALEAEIHPERPVAHPRPEIA